jgi:ribosomal protein L23
MDFAIVLMYIGKFKRAFRGKYLYKEKDWKKAIVTLKE